MIRRKQQSLCDLAAEGKLPSALARYLKTCRPANAQEGKKQAAGRFPNLAGFCAWLGVGIPDFERLRDAYPHLADHLLAVMEDEALNSGSASATLIGAYLKYRLNYAGREKGSEESAAECGEVKVIFEHDISEDGA